MIPACKAPLPAWLRMPDVPPPPGIMLPFSIPLQPPLGGTTGNPACDAGCIR